MPKNPTPKVMPVKINELCALYRMHMAAKESILLLHNEHRHAHMGFFDDWLEFHAIAADDVASKLRASPPSDEHEAYIRTEVLVGHGFACGDDLSEIGKLIAGHSAPPDL